MSNISFTVYGVAVPWSAPFTFHNQRTGQRGAFSSKKLKAWQSYVAMCAEPEVRGRKLIDGPIRMSMVFYLPRPASRKKDKYPDRKPDRINLAKAVEDALEGILYTNDSRIVGGPVDKFYAEPGEERVEIKVEEVT